MTAGRRGSALPKVQRWIDLLAALLSRRFPATFEELRRDVPSYRDAAPGASLMRMFERDKDELRAFGVPIETEEFGDPPTTGYRLRAENFYLPYLQVAASGARSTAAVPPAGYRALARLAFEPDELAVVADAAARVRSLGDPLLAADAESATRKLAFDLPVDAAQAGDTERVVADRVDPRPFALLGRAVLDRKWAWFDYHALSTDITERRQVEPYGLAFLGGHWYLIARDVERGALRQFRLGRLRNVEVNDKRPQSPDFEVPASFRLEDHARSREAWELGDDEAGEVVVEFRGSSGAARAAARLGQPVRGAPDRRRFTVRRPDTFARWLLSLAGDAVPVGPPAAVERFRAIARETLALYAGDGGAA